MEDVVATSAPRRRHSLKGWTIAGLLMLSAGPASTFLFYATGMMKAFAELQKTGGPPKRELADAINVVLLGTAGGIFVSFLGLFTLLGVGVVWLLRRE